METAKIIDRMAAIKKEKEQLDSEYASLQSELQIIGESALEDTKYKSVSFPGTDCKAVITVADKVTGILPSMYQSIFGKAFKDLVTIKNTMELNAEGKRIAAAVWNKEYCKGSVDEIVRSLSCGEKEKKSLMKKLIGKNFETDKKNLIKIGGLSEKEASDTAYLVSEVIAWNRIESVIRINNDGNVPKEALDRFISDLNAAVCVEQSTKVAIDSMED